MLMFLGESSQLNLTQYNVHCVAGALKKYLRELPNPILPVELYSSFIDAASESKFLLHVYRDISAFEMSQESYHAAAPHFSKVK